MEYLKRAVILAVVVFTLGFAPAAQAAETYLGDFCWERVTQGQSASVVVKLGVYDKEGGHYALYGSVTIPAQTPITNAIHGNAEVAGSSVYITTVRGGPTGSDESADIFYATLDATTLDGTFSELSMFYDEPSPVQTGVNRDTGTLTLITCP